MNVNAFCMVLLLALGMAPSALAYGDPAAGGFLLQVLLAGALGSVAVLKMHFGKIIGLFRGRNMTQSRRLADD
jgi:hypothetical protein